MGPQKASRSARPSTAAHCTEGRRLQSKLGTWGKRSMANHTRALPMRVDACTRTPAAHLQGHHDHRQQDGDGRADVSGGAHAAAVHRQPTGGRVRIIHHKLAVQAGPDHARNGCCQRELHGGVRWGSEASPLGGGGGGDRQRTGTGTRDAGGVLRASGEECKVVWCHATHRSLLPSLPHAPTSQPPASPPAFPHLRDSHAAHGCRPGCLPHRAARASATVGASSGCCSRLRSPALAG